jgi:hypothetical protein
VNVTHRVLLAATVVVVLAAPASAQFASDFPGVPRASISISGSTQSRLAWAFSGYKIPTTTGTSGDSLAGGIRLGIGQSFRVQSGFEIGFDFTLADGLLVQSPSSAATGTTTATTGTNNTYLRGLAGYALRIGAKLRPISSLDPDGNGYELAIGGAFQPQLKALYGAEKLGDSSRVGGQFNSDAVKPSTVFRNNPFTSLSASTIIAAMGSYRSKRLMGDLAIVSETVPDREASAEPSPISTVSGVSIKAGGAFRLTQGIAVGATYWGNGSPPWFDQIQFAPGKAKAEKYGFLIQLGGDPESGLDIMYTTPTGKYQESGRLYIRSRSTH